MSIATLKIGKREFVVIGRRDFESIRRKADELDELNAGDVAEARRRLKDEAGRSIPWEDVKRKAGLG